MNPNLREFLELPDDYIAEIKRRPVASGTLGGRPDQPLRIAVNTIRRTYTEQGEVEHLIGIPRPDTTAQETDTLVVFGTLGNVNRLLEVNE